MDASSAQASISPNECAAGASVLYLPIKDGLAASDFPYTLYALLCSSLSVNVELTKQVSANWSLAKNKCMSWLDMIGQC